MSEYQYYEFQAIDRPLSTEQQAAVRALSTRATITATSFVNEYHYGDFSGSPDKLVDRFYDAHLYYANWGSRRLLLRLPAGALTGVDLDQYLISDQHTHRTVKHQVVLDLGFEDDSGESWLEEESWTLATFVALRADLLDGDFRPLYLAWLAAVTTWRQNEDAFDEEDADLLEPPVPDGLAELTGAQQALVEFLAVDEDLLAEAASVSKPRSATPPADLRTWVADLPTTVKDAALLDLLTGNAASARTGLLQRHRGSTRNVAGTRTIGELLDSAWNRTVEREAHVAAERARASAERERRAAEKRAAHLDRLAQTPDASWRRVEELISTKTPRGYAEAVVLLTDLSHVASRDGAQFNFTARLGRLTERHRNKPALLRRLADADLHP